MIWYTVFLFIAGASFGGLVAYMLTNGVYEDGWNDAIKAIERIED